jgi:hypothetical protein
MSTDTYKHCLESEYNLDKEAVEFIIQIYELGGQAALEDAKRLWEAMPAKVIGVISFLGSMGLTDQIKKILAKVWGPLAQVLAAMVVGLGVGAILLALTAGVECIPKLAD